LELEVEIMQTEVILFLQELQPLHQLVEVQVVEILLLVKQEDQVVEVHQQLTLTLEVCLQEDQELVVKEMLVEQVVLQDHLDLLVVVEVVNLAPEEMEQMLELVDLEELV
tara:strand:+ start:216 stop:545 length:330 start_codon:yes stop_codon:yes gene_type:complete